MLMFSSRNCKYLIGIVLYSVLAQMVLISPFVGARIGRSIPGDKEFNSSMGIFVSFFMSLCIAASGIYFGNWFIADKEDRQNIGSDENCFGGNSRPLDLCYSQMHWITMLLLLVIVVAGSAVGYTIGSNVPDWI